MTETGRFFDNILYSEFDQAQVQRRLRRNGVLGDVANKLAVSAPGGMFVSVDTGEAFAEGFHYTNDAAKQLAIANNTSGSTRIDVVCIELLSGANTMLLKVVQGIPGGPAPTLIQVNASLYQLPLATITIPTGTTAAITGGMIADSRAYSRTVKVAEDVENNIIGYNHLVTGSVSNLLLNYRAIADIFTNTSFGASGYNNIGPVHSITVSAGCTALIITIQLSVFAGTAGGTEGAVHVYIDSTQRYQVAPAMPTSSAGVGAMGGALIIPGLSAGPHTVQVQVVYNAGASQIYCRPGTQPSIEGFAIQVAELRK